MNACFMSQLIRVLIAISSQNRPGSTTPVPSVLKYFLHPDLQRLLLLKGWTLDLHRFLKNELEMKEGCIQLEIVHRSISASFLAEQRTKMDALLEARIGQRRWLCRDDESSEGPMRDER